MACRESISSRISFFHLTAYSFTGPVCLFNVWLHHTPTTAIITFSAWLVIACLFSNIWKNSRTSCIFRALNNSTNVIMRFPCLGLRSTGLVGQLPLFCHHQETRDIRTGRRYRVKLFVCFRRDRAEIRKRHKFAKINPLSKSFLIFFVLKSFVLTIASVDISRTIQDQKVIASKKLFNLELGDKFSQVSHLNDQSEWSNDTNVHQRGFRQKRYVRFPHSEIMATGRGPSPKINGRPYYAPSGKFFDLRRRSGVEETF